MFSTKTENNSSWLEWTASYHESGGSDGNASTLLTATFAVLLSILIATLFVPRRKRCHPVAPGNLPFIGHTLSLVNSDEFMSVLTRWANDVARNSGTYEFYLFGQRWIVLCDEASVMRAMRMRPFKLCRPSRMNNAINSLGFTGLFTAEGNVWKKERRLVSPTLNMNHIGDYFSYIKLVASRLTSKWARERAASSALMDLSKYSLDIAALSILGMDFDSLNNPDHELARGIEELFHIMFRRSLSPVPYWKLPLCGNIDNGIQLSGKVAGILKDLIRNYNKEKESGHIDKAREKKTCLQNLVDASDGEDAKLEEDRVMGNLGTLIMAGTDTTSTTLAACLWELAHDHQLQEALYKEITQSGLEMENLTLSHVVNGFPRLHALLFEVLRLKGPAPMIFLEPGEPFDFYGEVIKPGTMVCALTAVLSKKATSDVPPGPSGEGPQNFCPQRWLVPQDSSDPSSPITVIQPSSKQGGYMPFGHGPRICPGAQLAKVEVLTGLFSILKKFELAPIANHPPVRRVSRFTETFDGEIQLALKERQ
ncbi:hypothetical protein HJC23_007904 [Cyclotella cryptica]|uniref:Cytochrome P450 n=1 Tax=Cyclotella cryptica TaxID=29204 RepID=A0ABD3R0S2_9STRA|eukprot:CCRYP_000262-RA/>CCRYP_000262-RA protein AED:0.07 eAED:0.07 QI:0/-1/0/1/-1/1/1/0/536